MLKHDRYLDCLEPFYRMIINMSLDVLTRCRPSRLEAGASLIQGDERQDLIKELHRVKTDIFMDMINSRQLALRPGVKRLVMEAFASGRASVKKDSACLVAPVLQINISAVIQYEKGHLTIHVQAFSICRA